jgi:hypothetical protein
VGPLGESVIAWALLPLVVYVVSLGLGLLVARILRLELPNPVLAPLGLCASIVLVMPGYRLGLGAWLATPLLVLTAAAGFTLSWRSRRAWINPGWIGVAALAAYGLYMAPVVLAGGWTWTGYNFVNDTAIQLQLADNLAHHGLHMPIQSLRTHAELESTSSGDATLYYYLRAAYPVGSHAVLASFAPLVPAPRAALYQPIIATLIALASMALGSLVARFAGARWAAIAGFAAVAANLTYAYGLQGNLKEIALIATLATSVAVAAELLRSTRPVAGGIAFALCLSAVLAVYGGAGLPFVGLLGLLVLAVAFLQRDSPLRRALPRTLGAAAATLVVAGLVAATDLANSIQALNDAFGSAGDGGSGGQLGDTSPPLGQLVRELPLSEVAGVWLGADYRIPVPSDRSTINAILIGLMLVAALAAFAWLVRHRSFGVLLFFVTAVATLLIVGPRIDPYAEAKLIAIAAPAVVLSAAVGVAALARHSVVAAALVGTVLLGGVMVSNAYTYHGIQLAPTARLESLQGIAERYQGRGRVLLAENEELAKYFMRDAYAIAEFDSLSPLRAQLLAGQATAGLHYDLDDQALEFLEAFAWIVQRRSPAASRPPANFRLDYENRWYRVWRRTEHPEVVAHMPLQSLHESAHTPRCADVRAFARRAGDDEQLMAVRREPSVELDPATMPRTFAWANHPTVPETVAPLTPGDSSNWLRFPGGRYRVWIRGTFGREIHARLDNREIGAAKGVDTPGSWHGVGTVRVSRGLHIVQLHRPGGGLAPGDGYVGALGPLAFEPLKPARMETLPAKDWKRLCGASYDWIEIVKS